MCQTCHFSGSATYTAAVPITSCCTREITCEEREPVSPTETETVIYYSVFLELWHGKTLFGGRYGKNY